MRGFYQALRQECVRCPARLKQFRLPLVRAHGELLALAIPAIMGWAMIQSIRGRSFLVC
jgi:hypothetical protein